MNPPFIHEITLLIVQSLNVEIKSTIIQEQIFSN